MREPGTSAVRNDMEDTGTEAIITELFGPLADRVCGGGPKSAYSNLVLSSVFLRHCARSRWADVRENVRVFLDAQHHPRELLRIIGRHADTTLKEHRLPTGSAAALRSLRGDAADDLAHVIRLCEELGPGDFPALLDRSGTWGGTPDESFFTPRSVVDLIVQMLSGDYGEAIRIYDPYARGGELLAGVLGIARGSSLSGASPSDDMLRIAGMHLLLSGGRADLHRGTATPWNQPAGQQADLIVANIPFNSRVPAAAKTRRAGPPPQGGGNYLWLEHIVASLRRAGRAIVLMPNQAAVSTDDGDQSVRTRMIREGTVEFIVALPRGLFAATRVGAMIWGLRAPAERPDSVLFIDIRQAGSKRGAQRILASAEIQSVADCLRSWRSGTADLASSLYGTGKAAVASTEEIRQRDYSLEPSDYLTDQLLDPGPAAIVGAPDLAAAVAARARAAWEADEKTARIVTATGDGQRPSGRRTYLSEICDPQAGPSHSMVKQAERAREGIPLIVPANLRGHRILVSGAELISAETAWDMARFRLRADDILFVRTGSAGPVALVTEAEEGWLFGTNLIRLRCRQDVEPGYLLAVLSSRSAQRWIRARTESSTAIPSISAKTLGKLPVNLPPLEEQRRVSELLAEVDMQIAAHRALAETAQDWRAVLADGLISGLLIAGGLGEQP